VAVISHRNAEEPKKERLAAVDALRLISLFAIVTALAASNVIVIIVHPLALMMLSGWIPYSFVTLLAFLIPLLMGQVIVRSPLTMPLAGVFRVSFNGH
jgi:hypothetical protein